MDSRELPAFLALLRTSGLGPLRGRRLIERFGTPSAVLAAGAAAWKAAGCSEALCAALAAPDHAGAAADLKWLGGHAERALIAFDDPRYPARLAQIARPPLALFARGETRLLGLPQLAIVGARAASAQGCANAALFAEGLARSGLVITSGLALGIDAAAHRAALAAGGTTIAVCGNGLDRVYPPRHRRLAEDIAAQGLIVSEFVPGTVPKPEHFPRRNRVIGGLSLGVLVVEAVRESGSLITARLAAEQGREVFALPGSIHNPLARGCHALIREGAVLTESVEDILVELAAQLPGLTAIAAPAASAAAAAPASTLEQALLEAIGHETRRLDDLVERLARPVAEISAALLALELRGEITVAAGERFTRLQSR